MNEEYSDYRYIPDDRDMSSSSSLSVFTVGDKVKILAGSTNRIIGIDVELTVDDASWLAEQLEHAADTIKSSALESEATER